MRLEAWVEVDEVMVDVIDVDVDDD
ncbi:unnamed protein product [uncultured virus]|nr:unnamed protein product [uncultured virus]